MKIYDPRFVNHDYLSLVESQIGDLGPTDSVTVNYIVAERFPQQEIDVWKLVVESGRKGMNRPAAIEGLTEMIAVMTPFVDKPIVRAAVWIGGQLHSMYIDQSTGRTIYRSSMNYPDPTAGEDAEHNEEGTNQSVNPSDGSTEF